MHSSTGTMVNHLKWQAALQSDARPSRWTRTDSMTFVSWQMTLRPRSMY